MRIGDPKAGDRRLPRKRPGRDAPVRVEVRRVGGLIPQLGVVNDALAIVDHEIANAVVGERSLVQPIRAGTAVAGGIVD